MKHKSIVFTSAHHYFFIFASLLFASLTASAQSQKRTLPIAAYRDFIRPHDVVTIKTIGSGKVEASRVDTANKVEVPVDKKKVIFNDNGKLSKIDKNSFQKLKASLHFNATEQNTWILPEVHIEPSSNPATPGTTEPVTYGIIITLQQPLHYDSSLKKFSADLGFILANESGSNTSTIDPVDIELESNEALIDPQSFKITHLSIPSSNVKILADHVNDSTLVTIRTIARPEGYTTYLKVRPILEISSNQKSLQGFGIEEIPITVKFIGSNSSDSALVSFSPEKGSINPKSLYVKYNQLATFSLRSDKLGDYKISAQSSIGDSNVITFHYSFPWLFLLSSLLGGLIGSIGKYLTDKDEKRSWLKPVIGGVLIGFIGAIAWYGLSVNLLSIKLSAGLNTLAVLALSALCAFFGISLMKSKLV